MEAGLTATDLKPSPLDQLRDWLAFAEQVGLHNATAMAVATVDEAGQPSVRNVLWRGVIDDGLVFYTNYESRKGSDLAANPRCEALFTWLPLDRQVRVTGNATPTTPRQSDAYFATRPRQSQLSALTSDQSRVIPDREWLERRFNALDAAHEGREVRRPEHWGGYVLRPHRYEFWQGRSFRLHDRLVYEFDGDNWVVSRLAP
jgi:pyridoxamine 5'-phosphate oxidase